MSTAGRDDNGIADVYVHDLLTCANNLVSAAPDGGSGGAPSLGGRFAGTHRVVFTSYPGDLVAVPPDGNGEPDLFVATLHGADLAVTGTNEWENGIQVVGQVANHGPDTAEDVQVAIDLPVGTPSVALLPGRCRQAGAAVVCDLGDLTAGGTDGAHLAFIVPAAPPEGAVVSAAVTSATPDPDGRKGAVRLPTTG